MPLVYGDVSQDPYSFTSSSNEVSDASIAASHQNLSRRHFLEWLAPSSLSTLELYTSTLSVLLNGQGGIIDYKMITKHASDVVTNAARARKTWRGSRRGQRSGTPAGPAAADHLQALASYDLRVLTFGHSAIVPLGGINVHVARGGYSGENGVESTTPVEAGLSWVIGKYRRTAGNFIGSKTFLDHLKNGPPRRRVGLIVEEAPARQGAKVLYKRHQTRLKGTLLAVEVRKEARWAVVAPLLFVTSRY
ncbi:hypothetical protein V8E53_006373 [Lactarius tabidus]